MKTENQVNLENAWKNASSFNKQLQLNLQELSDKSNYPKHWNILLTFIDLIKPNSILDIGCGAGSLFALLKKEHPSIGYFGLDFSLNAISIAKKNWRSKNFEVGDLFELSSEYVSSYDLVHLGALLDVLPNGDEALDKILKLNIKNLIIGRMELTQNPSYYKEYVAYEEIKTCQFFHNKQEFINKCSIKKYEVYQIENNFYLKKS